MAGWASLSFGMRFIAWRTEQGLAAQGFMKEQNPEKLASCTAARFFFRELKVSSDKV
jgi:hypothetical protein